MAYGLYLYKEVETLGGNTARLEIYQKDFTGSALEIDAIQSWKLVMDNQGGDLAEPIIKTSMNISIINTNQINYDVFFTPDATKFKVIYKLNGMTEWTGYLTPDSFIENLTYRDTIALTARDNIGLLEQIPYDGADYLFERLSKVRSVINHCFAKIEFQMALEFASIKTSYLNGAVVPDINIADSLINTWQYVDDKTYYEVVELILRSFALQMRYVGGNRYKIIDVNDFISLSNNAQEVIFINGGGQREIIPAWKDTTLEFKYDKLDNIYRGYLTSSDNYIQGSIGTTYFWHIINTSLENGWISSATPLRIYNPIPAKINPNWLYITGAFDGSSSLGYNDRLTYRINVEKASNPLKISYKASKILWKNAFDSSLGYATLRPTSPIFNSGDWVNPNIQLRMRVRLLTSGANYVLDGEWQNENGYTGSGMIIFTYEGKKENNDGDQEITLTMTNIPDDGELIIEFYPYELFDVDSFTAQLRYDLLPADNRLYALLIIKEIEIAHDKDIISDGVFKKVTINAAANIKGSIDLEFSQVPDFFGGFNFFGNGVFGDKGGGEIWPLIGWKWAGGTTYPLFELCARHIIHNNRVQKNKYNGEFITSISRLTRPLFNSIFNFDNKNLVLNYGDYDILDEVMTAELIEVFDYDDITLNFIDTGNKWSK